jgi:hypothetical protein|tara:strand:- start:2260 stop:3138 length:879 start_codon:yes stop_codon:yes gene_type:complete
MSIASLGINSTGLVANEYFAPQIKVSKKGLITYINDLNPDGNLDPASLQAEYDTLEAEYENDLEKYNLLISPTEGIPFFEDVLVTLDTTLNSLSSTMTTSSNNLTTAIDNYTPSVVTEYTLMSNQLNITDSFLFSNTDGNTSEQSLAQLYTGFEVPAGTYLLTGFLCADCIGGDTSKVNNSGSAMVMVISQTGNPTNFYGMFQHGRTTEFADQDVNARNQVSGQQFLTFAADATIDVNFYCAGGAIVGQPSYNNFALEWIIQPFATIGSGQNDLAGQTSPTEYYKSLCFRKL